jgi:hypothetical protein
LHRVSQGKIEKLDQTTSSTSNNQQTQTQTTYYQNKEIESFIESNYVSIKDRETKVFEFLANRARVVEKTDFNGKPTKKVQFVVIDINDTEQERRRFSK